MNNLDEALTLVIGVDCATDPRKVGLAAGLWDDQACRLLAMTAASPACLPADWVAAQLLARPGCRFVIGLDAPLGWPAPFGAGLARHQAGNAILADPRQFFRRETDRFIARVIGHTPMDVAADRIARTAFAALDLLARVSARVGRAIPLAWQPSLPGGSGALEVYPAALLRALGLPDHGYKDRADLAVRQQILAGLAHSIDLPDDLTPALADADVLDALLCVLASCDFLAGRAMPPEDLPLAQKEGWIWLRQP
jgi:hypothetical protein